jgi:hypothetical protein
MLCSTNLQVLSRNKLYSRLHKKDKIRQILTFLKFTLFTTIYIRICYFCTALNISYFELNFARW